MAPFTLILASQTGLAMPPIAVNSVEEALTRCETVDEADWEVAEIRDADDRTVMNSFQIRDELEKRGRASPFSARPL
jgi:hypothetical protein